MNKILLTADLHSIKGMRVNIVLDYLDYLEKYYFENDIKYIFFLGDIFDKSSSIKNEMFIPVFLKFFEMKQKNVKMLFILGNHDIFNIDNDSLVETFAPFGKVIKDTEYIDILGTECIFLPYTKDIKKIDDLDSNKLLFTHLSIADFSFDNAYHATEKHAFPKDIFEKFDMVFTGHFHRHQSYKNIVYVGSPYQLNRNDMGQNKGFVVLDIDTYNWKFEIYDNAPKFVEIDVSDINKIEKLDLENKIAVVNVDRKIEDFAKLRYILLEKGVVEILPVFETIEDEEVIVEDVKLNNNLEDIVMEYIQEQKRDKMVIKAFEKVLEEAV